MLEVNPMARTRTLLQWFGEHEKGRIHMTPSYQRRGGLWPAPNKKLLINSVLNRYDIPKLYLSDFTYVNTILNEGNKPYAVVDGKQRLETFFQFFRDELPLDDTPVYLDGKELDLSGLHFSDLAREYPKLAARFQDFVPTVMSVVSDRPGDVEMLFIRLNLNVPVSGAERRNAMPGPLPPLFRKLSQHKFFTVSARFSKQRGGDLNVAAKVLLMESEQGFTPIKKKELDQFVIRNVTEPDAKFAPLYKRAEDTLTAMSDIFFERDKLLTKQASIPIYYWLVRQHGSHRKDMIRPFLEQFEQERTKVRKESDAASRGEQGAQISDQTLNVYNRRIRSPDDKANLQFMYKTLETRFQRFTAEKTSS